MPSGFGIADEQRKSFSDTAHIVAIREIYPTLFGTQDLQFEAETQFKDNERGFVLDGQQAIDYIVRVKGKRTQSGVPFTVQERFRKTQFSRYQDITITEWYEASNRPAELYKLRANIFLYGYFDESEKRFTEWIAIDVPRLMMDIVSDILILKYGVNDRRQRFLTIGFQELRNHNLVIMHQKIASGR